MHKSLTLTAILGCASAWNLPFHDKIAKPDPADFENVELPTPTVGAPLGVSLPFHHDLVKPDPEHFADIVFPESPVLEATPSWANLVATSKHMPAHPLERSALKQQDCDPTFEICGTSL